MKKHHFFEKTYFSSKYASERADYSCDNPEKNFPTKGFLDQSRWNFNKNPKILKFPRLPFRIVCSASGPLELIIWVSGWS